MDGEEGDAVPPVHDDASSTPAGPDDGAMLVARGKLNVPPDMPVAGQPIEVIHLTESGASAETKGLSSAVHSKRLRPATPAGEADGYANHPAGKARV